MRTHINPVMVYGETNTEWIMSDMSVDMRWEL